jgi:Ca2+-binding RTX toxin-like protein/subtilisin-like proprotein convertase family protein
MSENLSSLEVKRAAELANLANQVYQDNGGKPSGEWEKVITSAEVPAIIEEDSKSGYYGAVYKKPDGTYDSQGKPNYEYALVHRGTNDWKDFFVDLGVGFDLLPQGQFNDANELLKQAKSMDPKFSEAVSHGEVANVGHSLGGLLAKLFGAAMGSNEIVAYNSPGGSHLLNDVAEYWDQINHNSTGTTNLTNRDYSNTVKEINAWGDPVSKIGGFGIGKEYDLNQGQSLLGSLLLDNPFAESVGTILGAKTFHSMDNLESQLNGESQKLINDAKTKNAPLNSDGTVNFNLIDNTNLDLSIRTNRTQGFLSNQNTTQTGNALGDGDWEVKMPLSIINGDNYKNVAPSGIVTDFFNPGRQEQSEYQSFVRDYTKDLGGLSKSIWNTSAAESIWNSTQLNVNLSNLTNNAIGARTFLNIDPVVLDLNDDGVKLTSYNNSEVTFDVDNDGKAERTGWVSKEDGILVEDQNNNGKIDNITETISEYYKLQGSNWTKDGEGKYSSDGLAALKKLDSNNDGKFNSSDAKWNDLKIWVDANGDAQTDAGELKTLTEAGIKEINLSNITQASKERNEGNIILAKSTYTTTDNKVKQVAAVDFTTNPIGYEFNDVNLGKLATAEDGTKSLVIKNENGETVIAGSDIAQNIFGNIGNDSITGDDRDNWISGGKGSDILKGGKGDDILIIDSEDKQENIDGGEGRDIAIINSDESVTLNLAKANIETAVGGNGDDILIGGTASNVFIDGGSGDDIIIGGAADDALAGSDGNDYIDGGFGDDLLRGHRGNDILIGGLGDDYLEGGLDDDKVFAGAGNDVIMEGAGNDEIDGGDGYDLVKYNGSYKDYKISRDGANYKVQDLKTGNIDSIKNIEGVRFNDVTLKLVDGNISPLPVADLITLQNKSDTVFISKADLLKNDLDVEGDTLSITSIQNVVGGTTRLVKSGSGEIIGVEFTPEKSFIGNMSFDYDIKDSKGAYSIVEQKNNDGTSVAAAMKARVTFKLASDPTDDLYAKQWYLSEINIQKAWADYSGEGVKIGVFEKGDFNINHQELDANTLASYKEDVTFRQIDQFAQHKTTVAGVIAAEKNGTGIVGVAYNAKLDGYSWDADETGLANLKNVDIANNSWGNSAKFGDNFSDPNNPNQAYASLLETAVKEGRSGLGTINIFAGGNQRQDGDNVNYHNLQNSRFVITTGSINQPGDLATLQQAATPFSNPGDAILVSAPGSNINSTSNLLTNENGSQFLGEFSSSQGTSFSAPIISGVVALMLQANPNLGYRDVQKILALSARQFNDPNTAWQENGANNWNGGAMHFSHDYGFGIVDAAAAVRLAETWKEVNTFYNEKSLIAESNNSGAAIADNTILSSTFPISGPNMNNIENVEVEVDLNHMNFSDLVIKLISPSGTESILMDHPTNSVYEGKLVFNFSSRAFLGEKVDGNWKLEITDSATGDVGYLNSWKLKFYGELNDGKSDLYVYTDEFAKLTDGSRGIIADTDGGVDTINAAAVSSDTTINLNSGKISKIAGKDVLIAGGPKGDEYYQKQALLPNKESELATKNSSLADKNQLLTAKQNEFAGLESAITNKTIEYSQKQTEYNAALKSYNENSSKIWFDTHTYLVTYGSGSNAEHFYKNNITGATEKLYGYQRDQKLSDYNSAFNTAKQKETDLNATVVQYNALIANRTFLPEEIGNLKNDILLLSSQVTSLQSEVNFIKVYLNSFDGSNPSIIENAYTGDGNDTIIGSDVANQIWGGRGNNTLTGNGGSDTFIIKKNAATVDTITDFKAGEDKIDLTDFGNISISNLNISQNGANAEIKFASGQKIILANVNAGAILTDSFFGIAESKNVINGTSANDTLKGTAQNDIIKAGTGLDVVNSYAGNDEIDGGADTDMLYGGDGDDTIYGGDGNDSIYGDGDLNLQTHEVNNFENRNGNNKLFGGAGNDDILGGSGKDYIDGGTGDDRLFGGAGDDIIIGGDGNNQLQGGVGNDVIDLGSGVETTFGTTQMNVAYGEAGSDKFVISDKFIGLKQKYDIIGDFDVNDPNEKIDLSRIKGVNKYSDLTITQNGSDTYITFNTSAFGYSQVIKLENVDSTKLNSSKFIIINEAPNTSDDFAKTAEDKAININVFANDSDDKTDAGKIKITILTNPANGTVVVNYDGTVTYNPSANWNGIDQFEYQLTDAGGLVSPKAKVVVNIDPANDAPIVTKTIGDQIFYSTKGINFKVDDVFKEVDGESLTYSASLSDNSPLPDWISFNPFTLNFSGAAPTTEGNFVIKLTAQDASGNTTSTNIKLIVDNSIIIGTDGDDAINGTSLANTIDGGKGNDIINGDAGNDILYGSAGNDQISGSSGNDKLYGEDGNDILKGEAGDDLLDGGDGNDKLYSSGSGDDDTLTGGLGSDIFVIGNDIISNDVITDFDISDPNEKIDLSNFVAAKHGFSTLAKISDLNITQVGSDAKIAFSNSSKTLTVKNVKVSDLTADKFILNNAPTANSAISDQKFYITKNFNFNLSNNFSDADNNIVSYSATLVDDSPLPDWLNFNSITGDFYGQAPNSVSSLNIKLTAIDKYGLTASANFKFNLNNFILGTDSNDTIIGTNADDLIEGGDGNDVIDGGYGSDDIYGGEGDDQLSSGAGYDKLYGEAGNDILIGNGASQILDGGDGNDKLYSYGSSGYFTGGNGSDTFVISSISTSNDIITDFDINDPNEKIDLSAFKDVATDISQLTMEQIGSDTKISFASKSKTILVKNVSPNQLTVAKFIGLTDNKNSTGSLTINGTNGNDTLVGGSGDDIIKGNNGNDTIKGGLGSNLLTGGAGDDTFVISKNPGKTDVIADLEAFDSLSFDGFAAGTKLSNFSYTEEGNSVTFNLGDGQNLTFQNAKAADVLHYLSFGSQINLSDSSSVISYTGTSGNDKIIISTNYRDGNVVNGGDGNDIISGNAQDDLLNGGKGNDILKGGDWFDIFEINKNPGDKDTVIDFKMINDTIVLKGFTDPNLANYPASQVGSDVVVDLGDGQTLTLKNFNILDLPYLPSYSNRIYNQSSQISGTDGNDMILDFKRLGPVINPGKGNDLVYLNGAILNTLVAIDKNPADSDSIVFNSGYQQKVILRGFDSDILDKVKFLPSSSPYTLHIDLGDGQILTTYGFQQSEFKNYIDVEKSITPTDGNDVLSAGYFSTSVDGGAGNDIITGNNLGNTLSGGDGDDKITAGSGNDTINGGSGNDKITTGAGNDTVDAGSGNDEINITDGGNKTIIGGDGSDIYKISAFTGDITITDFAVSDPNEKIDLKGVTTIFSFSDLVISQSGSDAIIQLSSLQKIILKNTDKNLLTADKFVLYNNHFDGSPINDSLSGGDGSDIINGLGGNDSVYLSSKGSDTVDLGAGNDSFTVSGNGFYGNDNVTGGAGNDKFSIDLGYSSYDTSNYILTINDFEASNPNEKIYISNGSSTNMDFAKDLKIDQIGNDVQIKLTNGSSNKAVILKNVNKADLSANNIVVPQELYKAIATESDDNITYDSNAGIKNLTGQDYSIIFNSGGISAGGTLTINSPTSTIVVSNGNTTISLHTFDATKDRVKVDPTYGIAKYSDMPLVQEGSNVVMNFANKNTKVILENVNLNDLREDDFIFYNHSTSGNDTINGLGGNDYIEGGEGNDTISGGNGNDKLLGGNGNDSISGDTGDDEIYGGDGNDSLIDYAGVNKLYGGAGNDNLGVSMQNNSISNNELYGGDGDDIIQFSTGGTNMAKGGAGEDEFIVYGGDNEIYGEEGVDNFIIDRAYSAIFDGNGNYTVTDAPSTTTIHDFDPSAETIMLGDFDKESLDDFDIVQDGNDVIFNLSSMQTLRLSNVTKSSLNQGNIILPDKHIHDNYYYTFDDRTNEYSVRDLNKLMAESNDPYDFYQGPVAEIASDYDPVLMKMVSNFDATKDKIYLGKIKTLEKFEDLKITQYSIAQSYGSPSEFTLIDLGNGTFVKLNGFYNLTADNFTFNKAPTANLSSANINEDSQIVLDVVSKAVDIDDDVLSITGITSPSHGSATIVTDEQGRQKISYIPTPNFNGIDQFNYTISDGRNGVVTKTLTVTVKSVNDNPTVIIADANVNEDNSVIIDVLAGASDADGDQLSIVGIYGVINGVANVVDGKIVYTPNANYSGLTNFDYTISDGNGGFVTKTLNIDVKGVNDAPTIASIISSSVVDEDAVNTVLNAAVVSDAFSDIDGDVLTYEALLSNGNPLPSWLTINSVTGEIISTNPSNNQVGNHSIVITATDSSGASVSQNFVVTVNNVNDTPTAQAVLSSINEDTQKLTLAFNASDVDAGDSLTYSILSNPALGSVINNNDGTFTLNLGNDFQNLALGQTKDVSFTYVATDKSGVQSNVSTATITITGTNDLPTASIASIATNEDNSVKIDVLAGASDVDAGDILSLTSVTNGSHGTASIVTDANGNKAISYVPNADYNGSDVISYTISDNNGGLVTKELTVTVNAVDDAPIVASAVQNQAIQSGKAFTYQLPNNLFSDVDGDSLTINATLADGSPLPSWLSFDGSKFSGTPNVSTATNFAIKLMATDPSGASVSSNFGINITNPNNAPVAKDDAFATNEDTSLTISFASILKNDSDIEDKTNIQKLTKDNIIFNNPSNGTITVTDTGIVYKPNKDYNGSDAITYQIKDSGGALSNVASINLTVKPVNDIAVAGNDSFLTDEDKSITIKLSDLLANDSDVEDGATIKSLTMDKFVFNNPSKGVIVKDAVNGTITYTPNKNYNGADSLTYQIKDSGGALSNVASINLSVKPVNDIAVAGNDSFVTDEDKPITIKLSDLLANDSDVEDGAAIQSLMMDKFVFSNPSKGVIVKDAENGTITYTTNKNYNGTDSLTYQIKDSSGALSNKATISLTINSVNDAPVAVNDSFTTNEDTSLTISFASILANDSDVEDGANIKKLTKDNIIFNNPSNGTITITDTGIIYAPNKDFNGSDSLTYQIKDSSGMLSNSATIILTVKPVNDAPVAASDFFIANEDTPITIKLADLLANDFDVEDGAAIQNLTLDKFVFSNPLKGKIVKDAINNTIIYTPNKDYNGSDSLTYQIKDNNGTLSNKATINLTIESVNDAPVIGTKLANQSVKAGNLFNYTLPVNLFTDIDKDALNYSAKLADGSDLPSWLKFDNATKVFSGTSPSGITSSLSIKVTASDGSLDASQSFALNITSNVINGTVKNDIINGTALNDEIYGNDGIDNIKGNAGNDLIIGGKGADVLLGGTGNDQFIFKNLTDSTTTASDLIIDFTKGEDKINLSDLGFEDITNQSVSNNSAHGLEYYFDDKNTVIEDPNSNFILKLSGYIILDHNDFAF